MPTLANGDPPEHTRIRKIANRAFTRRRVATLEPLIVKEAERLVKAIAPRGEGDVVAEIGWPLAEYAVALSVGYPARSPRHRAGRHGGLRRHHRSRASGARARGGRRCQCGVRRALPIAAGTPDGAAGRRPDRDPRELRRDRAGGGQRALPGDAGRPRNQRPADLPRGSARLRVGRGSRLLRHDAAARRIVEETLRHSSPVRAMERTTTRPVELGGVSLEEGAPLLVLFESSNRDEDFVADGDAFRPDRSDARDHVAFGRGAHFCLGAEVARAEARAAIRALETLPGLELVPGQRYEPFPNVGIFGLRALLVRWRSSGAS